MKKIFIKNLIWKDRKYYVAQALNVDISSFGKTKKEALSNLREAVELYLEDARPQDVRKVERPELVTTAISYA